LIFSVFKIASLPSLRTKKNVFAKGGIADLSTLAGANGFVPHCSLDPRESIPKTASRSVQPFCRARERDQQTDTHIDRPRYSVCSTGHTLFYVMRPKIPSIKSLIRFRPTLSVGPFCRLHKVHNKLYLLAHPASLGIASPVSLGDCDVNVSLAHAIATRLQNVSSAANETQKDLHSSHFIAKARNLLRSRSLLFSHSATRNTP